MQKQSDLGPKATSERGNGVRWLFAIGGILVAVGSIVLAGWIFRVAALVQLIPGLAGMPYSSAIGISLAGGALASAGSRLAPNRNEGTDLRHPGRMLPFVLAALLVLLGLLALVGWESHRRLGLVPKEVWFPDPNPYSGRMRPLSAVAFIAIGLGVARTLLSSASGRSLTVHGLSLLATTVGLLGVIGSVASFGRVFSWFLGPTLPVGICFLLAGLGLLLLTQVRPDSPPLQGAGDVDRIGYLAGAIAIFIGMVGLVGGFAVLFPQMKDELQGKLAMSLANRVGQLQAEITDTWVRTSAFANNPPFLRAMRRLDANPRDARARAEIAELAQEYRTSVFTGVVFRTSTGHVVARAGSFALKPELAFPLRLPAPSTLLWDDGYVMHTRVEMIEARQVVGSMEAEWRLDPEILGDLQASGDFGNTLTFAICAPSTPNHMDCFPFRDTEGRILRNVPDRLRGRLVPMAHALAGNTGQVDTLDYRGVKVIAAYQPVGSSGLGAELRIDAEQLYAPIAHRVWPLLYGLPILAFVAVLLVRLQMLPIVRRMSESEVRFRTMADYTYDWEYWRGVDREFIYVTPSCERTTGYTQSEFLADPELIDHIVHPEDRERLETHLKDYRDDTEHALDFRILTKGGEVRWIAHGCHPVFRENGEFLGRRASNREITDRKRAEAQLEDTKELLEMALEASALAIWDYDIRGGKVSFDAHWAAMVGAAPGATVVDTQTLIRRIHPDDARQIANVAGAAMKGEMSLFQEQVRYETQSGAWKWILCSGMIKDRDAQGGAIRAIGTVRDVTEQKSVEEQFHHWAYYDRLTDLPNRRLLEDRLQQSVAQAHRGRSRLALLFIDLDKFKPINDEFGHEVGDWLLRTAALRMQECARQSDTVARLGGDEFVAVLPTIRDVTDAIGVAEKIRKTLAAPFVTSDGNRLSISSSIGIALYPDHARNARELLHRGDEAMYSAKGAGRNVVIVSEAPSSPLRVEYPAAHLVWKPGYACGESTIDRQHRQLFRLANVLLDRAATRETDPKRFSAAFDALLSHVAQHFSDEESILREHGDLQLGEHAQEHERLMERALELRRQADQPDCPIGKVLQFLAGEVVAEHMLRMDRKFFGLFQSEKESKHLGDEKHGAAEGAKRANSS